MTFRTKRKVRRRNDPGEGSVRDKTKLVVAACELVRLDIKASGPNLDLASGSN
jgi:hypothetical protein